MASATGKVWFGGFSTFSGYKQYAFTGLDGRGSTVWTDDGIDTLVFAFSKLDAYLGNGNNDVFGSRQADLVVGGDGSDRISGGAGDDIISGGGGANVLDGGWGNDTIVFGSLDFVKPGPGNDTLVYTPALGSNGSPYVDGFAVGDTLRLPGVSEGDLHIIGNDLVAKVTAYNDGNPVVSEVHFGGVVDAVELVGGLHAAVKAGMLQVDDFWGAKG